MAVPSKAKPWKISPLAWAIASTEPNSPICAKPALFTSATLGLAIFVR